MAGRKLNKVEVLAWSIGRDGLQRRGFAMYPIILDLERDRETSQSLGDIFGGLDEADKLLPYPDIGIQEDMDSQNSIRSK